MSRRNRKSQINFPIFVYYSFHDRNCSVEVDMIDQPRRMRGDATDCHYNITKDIIG